MSDERDDRRDDRDDAPRERVREEDTCSLLIRNLRYETSPEMVRKEFERFGTVRDVYLPLDYSTRKPRGFGFVEFMSRDDAERAMDEMNQSTFDGNTISVMRAQHGRKSPGAMRNRMPSDGGGRRGSGGGGGYGRDRYRDRSRSRERDRDYRRRYDDDEYDRRRRRYDDDDRDYRRDRDDRDGDRRGGGGGGRDYAYDRRDDRDREERNGYHRDDRRDDRDRD
ncbi:unnamed protein product [Vitrella brassicaformis CCMP3155]|uniref:RRM domain-containing protein n=1 Tax=Vitrella brassicaformis (strain CCMP3155) TaxID=1169540 RepID=A0A0G4EIZ2_VITBC|nr:unnamed protein product [Vitrella brassicaformis CCMP3155]|eukprot:CEL95964.1 unnamed protein product [Vitrella brassicaformis CCMP3155]